ncbi:hypothetical protein F4823DRAFT_567883 [Ustulina deusta]|nr:hypothetical protein F4823DRAFT_567883 [Ustulina deusta]
MDLTEENVAKLPSDGSRFSSYYGSSRGTRTPAVSRISSSPVVAALAALPPVARLEQAKKLAYFYMSHLSRLGVKGRRILRNDELYIAGQDDVRFRRSGNHTKDADNPEYWEAKVHFFREKYKPIRDEMYPPIIIDPESPSMIRQAEIDRQVSPPTTVDNNTLSQPLTQPSTYTSPIEPNFPSISQERLGEVTVTEKSEPRAPKRKRSDLEHEGERANSKKCAQTPLSPQTASKKIGEPTKAQPTRKNGSSRSPSRPVALRRSARIAALPKIKYY